MEGLVAIPHPIPYQGSKRGFAHLILSFFPDDVGRLIEPFAGSAAVSLAAAYHDKAHAFVLNDANVPLVQLWERIIRRPSEISDRYQEIWQAQFVDERAYYDRIRDEFNRTQRPDYFLFLLTRCVKAAVRYNASGAFNQSPDNRRKGTNPATMRTNIHGASRLLSNKTTLLHHDYRLALADATPRDVMYMDPPYQGVCGNRDPRYVAGLAANPFTTELAALNAKGISYILSYDGRTGEKNYGMPLPASLDLTRIEIDAGRSSQATLLGRSSITYESLYLSPALVQRLGRDVTVVRNEPAMRTAPFEMAS
jgi:DNA adenine methylase